MRRICLVLGVSLVALAATGASALDFQQKSFYAQGLLSLPMGDFGDYANLGFGGGIGMLIPHDAMWSFRGEISYNTYSTDDGPGYSTSVSEIPLVALAQYNLTNSQAYLLGGLGLAFGHGSVKFDNPLYPAISDNSTDLDLVLGGGYNVAPQVDIQARFNVISNANQISFHGVYHF